MEDVGAVRPVLQGLAATADDTLQVAGQGLHAGFGVAVDAVFEVEGEDG